MKSFKHFLSEQDDNISEQDALQKYKEYKEDFVRLQLSDFFAGHKDEEWFREKYHPDLCVERRRVANENVTRRLRVFQELMAANWFDDRPIVYDNSDALVKFMDALVIKLEGGNNADLRMLDATAPPAPKDDAKKSKSEKAGSKKPLKKKKKRKHSDSDSSDSESSSSSGSNSDSSSNSDSEDEEEEGQHHRGKRRASKERAKSAAADAVAAADGATDKEDAAKTAQDEGAAVVAPTDAAVAVPVSEEVSDADKDKDDAEGQASEAMEESKEEPVPDEDAPTPTEAEQPTENGVEPAAAPTAEGAVSAVAAANGGPSGATVTSAPDTLTPVSSQPLHKTNSIFLRNLHPSITRQEIEELCKKYQGFMRLALQDPAAERKFFRRGWVTFAPDINIKEVCWNLNNIPLKECDLGAIVNRELSQRVRPVGMAACHKPVMRADIKFAARIIQQLDQRQGLWQPEAAGPAALAFSIVSSNPLMRNITDYLVEEGSYEEQLLGKSVADAAAGSAEGPRDETSIERDAELAGVLDRLVFYLRAVHSVDYYAAVEYPNEDEMPHRCGIMHARGAPVPPEKSSLAQREIDNHLRDFELKVKHLMEHAELLKDEDVKRMGSKDAARAVEEFLAANTQELAKDKWLCPLSGKKFKGPEFVRKHIFNKHADSVDAVKKEVLFFNNYLRDPKRPQLPEHAGVAGAGAAGSSASHHTPGQRSYAGDRSEQRDHRGAAGGGYDRGYADGGGFDRGYAGGGSYDHSGGRHGGGWYDNGGGRSPPQMRSYGSGGNSGGYGGGAGYGGGGYAGGGGYDRGGSGGGYGGYGRRPYGDRGYGDNRRGGGGQYGGDRGGGGMQREGRSYKIMRPDGRKVLTYMDLDAPTDEY